MIDFPRTADFVALVKRIIWFEDPDQAVQDLNRFLAYAMTYATFEDMQEIRRFASDEALRTALRNAPPGIMDSRSWAYWHLKLGLQPVTEPPVRVYE